MGREEQKEQTRAAILEAARALFEERGFAGASIRAIASEAGVAAGTVMLHFEDKRDLLHSALFADLEATIDRALNSLPAGSLQAQLDHLTGAMFAYYEARPQLSRTLLRESLFAEPPWAEAFAAQVGRVHGRLRQLFEAAIERGELADDAQLDRLGVAYFSFYYFALISWVQGAHPDPVGMVHNLVSQHLEGVRPGPGPDDPGDAPNGETDE
jgi:AcrR family transcriptional regulator